MSPNDEPKKEKNDETTEIYNVKPPLTCGKGRHYFIQVSGMKVKCQKCPLGFNITPSAEVKNGHIYIDSALVV